MEDINLLVYVADKNIANVGLDVDQGDNNPTRPGGHEFWKLPSKLSIETRTSIKQ